MPSGSRPLLSLDALAPDSKLLDAARRLVSLGAFTQADIGVVACRGATSKASRAVMAQRLRERMEEAGWLAAYRATDASGLLLSDTREGAQVFHLTSLARQELSRALAKETGRYAQYTEHLNRTLAECPPPSQLPRKGVLLANRWLYANALRMDGVEGIRHLSVGEYALRGELRFANPKPGWSGFDIKNVVDRMPDGLLLALKHEHLPGVGPSISLEGLTLVEIERRFEDAAKHFRLFLHFDANGELRPLYSEVFAGLGSASGTDVREQAVVLPTCIQVVRAVERTTGRAKKHKNAGVQSGEAVTASYLLELAKVFFFGTTLIPKELRSDRTEKIAKELHRSGILERRAFVTSPAEASIERFRWMLSKVEVVTVEVHGRHGTLTETCVHQNGALRLTVQPQTLDEVFKSEYPALVGVKTVARSVNTQAPANHSAPAPEPVRPPTPPAPSKHTPPATPPSSSPASPKPRVHSPYRELVRRIIRSQVDKVSKAGLDGSDAWQKVALTDLETLVDALERLMVKEGLQSERQPAAACAAHQWLTNSDEDPSDASVEIGYRCIFVFDHDTGRDP